MDGKVEVVATWRKREEKIAVINASGCKSDEETIVRKLIDELNELIDH